MPGEAPPALVWKEKPSCKQARRLMTLAAVSAITRPTGSRVIRVVPERMPLGSPMASTWTT